MPQLSKVKRLVVLTDRNARATGGLEFVGEYEELLGAASPDFEFADFDENVQATTFYTTGTTGLPKGVYYSHRQLVLHAITELAMFGLAAKQGRFHRDDVYMPVTPMFHVHAWGFPWAATLAGVKQVYPGRYDPALLIKLIKTEGVTFTHGVPTLLQMLLDAAAKANVDLAGLKMVIGGSALTKALAKQAMERGVDVFAGYGMSETVQVFGRTVQVFGRRQRTVQVFGRRQRTVQVFGRRQRRDFPHAQPAGVQKASRHEVAGRLAPGGRRALWRFDARAGSMGAATLERGELHACRRERVREREKRVSRLLEGMSGGRAH